MCQVWNFYHSVELAIMSFSSRISMPPSFALCCGSCDFDYQYHNKQLTTLTDDVSPSGFYMVQTNDTTRVGTIFTNTTQTLFLSILALTSEKQKTVMASCDELTPHPGPVEMKHQGHHAKGLIWVLSGQLMERRILDSVSQCKIKWGKGNIKGNKTLTHWNAADIATAVLKCTE